MFVSEHKQLKQKQNVPVQWICESALWLKVTVVLCHLLPNYEKVLKKKIHMAVFPHGIGKFLASKNAEWLVTSRNYITANTLTCLCCSIWNRIWIIS